MDIVIELIFLIIFAVAAVVWGVSLRKASRLGKDRQSLPNPESVEGDSTRWSEPLANPYANDGEFEDAAQWNLVGQETIENLTTTAAIQQLAKKVAEGMGHPLLANHYRVERPSPETLHVSAANAPSIPGQTLAMDRAEFEAVSAGQERVEIRYRVSYQRQAKKSRRIALGIILGLGLPFLLIGSALLWFFVVQNPNPAVRWQVFQGLQIAHVLWPPFLFIGIFNASVKRTRNAIPNMIRSIEYQG